MESAGSQGAEAGTVAVWTGRLGRKKADKEQVVEAGTHTLGSQHPPATGGASPEAGEAFAAYS